MLFLRDKFEVLLLTVLLTVMMTIWVSQGYPEALSEYVFGTFTAWLALMRIVQKPSVQTENIQAENIEAANTEFGDVISIPDSKLNKPKTGE